MPENEEVTAPTLEDSAASYANASMDVQRLERDRETLAQQLAGIEARLAAARQRKDQAHAGLRGTVK